MADFNGQEKGKKELDESLARVILYCRNTLGSIINNVNLRDSKLFLKLRSLEDGFKYAESTFNMLKELKYKQSIGSENGLPFKEVHSIANKRELKKCDFDDNRSIIGADSNYFMIPKEIISTLFKNTIWIDPKIINLHPSSIGYNITKNGDTKQIASHESKLEIEDNSHYSRSNIDDKCANFKINAKLDKSVFKYDNLNKHNKLLSDKKHTSCKSNSSEDEHDWMCFYCEICIDEEKFVRTTCDCKLHIKCFKKKMKECLRGLRCRVFCNEIKCRGSVTLDNARQFLDDQKDRALFEFCSYLECNKDICWCTNCKQFIYQISSYKENCSKCRRKVTRVYELRYSYSHLETINSDESKQKIKEQYREIVKHIKTFKLSKGESWRSMIETLNKKNQNSQKKYGKIR